ncbi:MAG: PEGA domain-containing protein [Spirochaetales bacterium]|nr:MAG: PEGA domain-containing protein [Spirochaetales bacterium]
MAKKQTSDDTSQQDIHVTLKPFLGMKPGLYLTIIYALLLALIIYLVLFLPGIRKNGSHLRFSVHPAGAAVYVDGQYAGAAPCEVFVSRGNHTIVVSKPFFEPAEMPMTIKGRVFASLIAPRRLAVPVDLAMKDPQGLLSARFEEVNKWALIDRVFYNYQVPPVLTDTVKDLSAAGNAGSAAAAEWISVLPAVVSNEYILKDYIDAASRTVTGNGALSPLQAVSMVRDAAVFIDSGGASALWLGSILPDVQKKILQETDWYKKRVADYVEKIKAAEKSVSDEIAASLKVSGISFSRIPGGNFLAGGDRAGINTRNIEKEKDVPFPSSVPGFFIMDYEVSREEYAMFTAENPEWRKENLDALLKEKLVTGDYLAVDEAASENPAVPADSQYNVSWWAADAFCGWLTTKLPPSLAGDYEVRLPAELEWEWAAGNRLPADFTDGLWEWCGNWYYPEVFFFPALWDKLDNNPQYRGTEKSVRGGSWANQPGSIKNETRGSQPPDWCTPFLGFRAVIAPKK